MRHNCIEIINEVAVSHIDSAIERANLYVEPYANTGEFIIDGLVDGKWQCLYWATLDDGTGDSCAAAKVDTLIAHPEAGWGGIIPEDQLDDGEKKWYGSIRLRNCRSTMAGTHCRFSELILVFSGREEWQDVIYCARVLRCLKDALMIDFELPFGLIDDPKWGTIMNLVMA